MTFTRFNRLFHRWASIAVAVPLLLVILTGMLLLLKKESSWIQPASQRGSSRELALEFDQILEIAKTVPEARIGSWDDIDRLDVRPAKGMVKVRAENRWEIQIDTCTGDILQVAYRRSDLLESLHDGSFFHDKVRLWIFLPAAVLLLGLWLSGIYLFALHIHLRRKSRRSRKC